jgi:hypothetical protein
MKENASLQKIKNNNNKNNKKSAFYAFIFLAFFLANLKSKLGHNWPYLTTSKARSKNFEWQH